VTAQIEVAPLPPRWVVRLAWFAHRALYGISFGRFGLRRPTGEQWGMLRLHTTGRRTGRERIAILGYIEDGPNLATSAMNGWADPEPAWWLNLLAEPEATVDLVDGPRRVRARVAEGGERDRLWAQWRVFNPRRDAYAARRSRRTEIVVLEPVAA
jgi:deazaflavin-dependent oxidoreductase (nitroreductase family)